MKLYAVGFELCDEAGDVVATFKAFDDESLIIELQQSIWLVDDFHKLANAYELATDELKKGVEI